MDDRDCLDLAVTSAHPSVGRFGRPAGLLEPFGLLPRRPCPFSHRGAHEPDAMMKHMAAARFGPGLLSSLLAAAEVLDSLQPGCFYAFVICLCQTLNPVQLLL